MKNPIACNSKLENNELEKFPLCPNFTIFKIFVRK